MATRKSTFPMGVSEICAAYQAERDAHPVWMAAPKSEKEMEEVRREAAEFQANIDRMEADRNTK